MADSKNGGKMPPRVYVGAADSEDPYSLMRPIVFDPALWIFECLICGSAVARPALHFSFYHNDN